MTRRRAIWAICLVLAAASLAAQPWQPVAGRFGFRVAVEGESVQADFGSFAVTPYTDAMRQPVGFDVEVDMRAVSSGNADADAEMAAADWLDVATYPVARFRARRVESAPAGGYIAHGDFTLKDTIRPISVPFAWQPVAGGVRMTGEVLLDRRLFRVGPDDNRSVAAEVTVFFDFIWDHGGD
jgi:polyisoprenoid-binding protein YceI